MNGIDTPNRITPVIAQRITDDFVCLYLVPPSMAWKRMTKADTQALTDAGKWILSIFESTANRALGGETAGTADAKTVLQEAAIVSQPKSSAIYFNAADFDAQAKDMSTIGAYFQAARPIINAAGYKVGGYGSYAVIEYLFRKGLIDCGWQTYAWSNGKLSQYANVYQYKNGTNLYGLSCDSNYSYGGEGFWNLNGINTSVKEEGRSCGNGLESKDR